MAKLEASDTVVLGISVDSPAANAAFAKQIAVTFPLLSDMNRKVLTAYGILKPYDVQGDKYEWAQRTTIECKGISTSGRREPRSSWTRKEKFSMWSKETARWIPTALSQFAQTCTNTRA